MNFDDDIRSQVLSVLPHDAAKRPELDRMTPSELLAIYFNWRYRFIDSRPRRVHASQPLTRNPLSIAHKPALDDIILKIANGDDLTPHLSTRIRHGYESSSSGNYNRRGDLDLLLAEWGLHHLHLSTTLRPDGFVDRSGPLLFAAFGPEDAYLIDIFPHGAWTREALAHVLIDEFPNSGFVHELPGAKGLDRQISEQERSQQRGAGISSPLIQRNCRVYYVGIGGITSAGTSAISTVQANRVLRWAKSFGQAVAADPDFISTALKAYGKEPPTTPDLHLVINPDGRCCILEAETGVPFMPDF